MKRIRRAQGPGDVPKTNWAQTESEGFDAWNSITLGFLALKKNSSCATLLFWQLTASICQGHVAKQLASCSVAGDTKRPCTICKLPQILQIFVANVRTCLLSFGARLNLLGLTPYWTLLDLAWIGLDPAQTGLDPDPAGLCSSSGTLS